MEFSDLKKLCVAAFGAEKNAPVAYSCGEEKFTSAELSKAVAKEFRDLCGYVEGKGCSYRTFKKNENTIFELIEETITEVLPPRVEAQYAQFAEVKTIPQGDRAVFRLKVTDASKRRAKTFVTRAGLAGRYETFMLDGKELEVQTSAIAGAARIGFEEFLDGRWEFSEFTTLIMEGIDEYIYKTIMDELAALAAALPAKNKATGNGFIEDDFDDLLAAIDTYGKATIYCTQEFANKMVPSDARMSGDMKNRLWDNGWLGNYKGHNVVVLAQSFTDIDNKTKVVNPQIAYMIPTGTEKPIKIVFEGQAQTRSVEDNDDWSTDLQTYIKVGVGTIAQLEGNHFIGAYTNSSLSQTR
jgi:hypothetical protein